MSNVTMSKYWKHIVAAIFGLFAVALVILVVTGKIQLTINRYVSEGEQKCVESGGIYYRGGFSADNCVFPPTESRLGDD